MKNSLFFNLRIFHYAMSYCEENGQCKELEYIIGCDVGWSYLYATNVTHGRFKLGEEVIASDPLYSYLYAREVIGGRFELGEEVMVSNNPTINRMYQEFLESL